MAIQQDEDAIPDFLRVDGARPARTSQATSSKEFYGWPSKELKAVTLLDGEGKTQRVRTPVTALQGLITPVELHYVVQHFDVPPAVPAVRWNLSITGEVKKPLTLNYEELNRFPGRTVRTVMECSGSDATYFEYFKGEDLSHRPSGSQP